MTGTFQSDTGGTSIPMLSYMQLKVKMHKTQKHFAIIILCISICCITIYFRRRIQEKNTEMLGYIEVATDLEKTLIEKCQEIESISNNLGVIGSELKTSEGYISEIFYKQYELLNKLTSTYYETHVCNKDMEAIYKQVSLEIERLSSDKKAISQLENFVNRYRRNIMNTIRTHLPDLTNMDYRLLCYLCAGFSAKAISIFTGDSTNNIYVVHSYDIDPHSYDVDPLEEGRAFKEQSLFACKQAAA